MTLRRLVAMYEARCEYDLAFNKAAWNRTYSLLALIANCHRDAKKTPKPFTPEDFDPTAKKPEPIPVGIEALKVFLTPEERAKADAIKPTPPPCRSTTTSGN